MIDFRKLFALAVLAILPLMGTEMGTAQETKLDDLHFSVFGYRIETDPEVNAYIEAGDYAKAEEKARELNLNNLAIALICAYQGKKDEAFNLLTKYFGGGIEAEKKNSARQRAMLLGSVSSDLAGEFYSYVIEHKLITLSKDEFLCWEIGGLIWKNRLEEAETKLNLLLDDPSYLCIDLVPTTYFLRSRLLSGDFKKYQEKTKLLLEKLLAKYPDERFLKMQWITSLAPTDPQKALEELDLLQESLPSYDRDHVRICIIRDAISESLDETLPEETELESPCCTESDSNSESANNPRRLLKLEQTSEVMAYLAAQELAKGEARARECNLDPRLIAELCVFQGKNDEAFRLLLEFIRKTPEEQKKEATLQAVKQLQVLTSMDWADELCLYVIDHKIITLSENDPASWEISVLIRKKQLEEAETKLNLLLDSSYADEDAISVTFLFLGRLARANAEQYKEKRLILLEKLLAKFPDNLQVKFAWISALKEADPKKALAELDLLQVSLPVRDKENRLKIHFTKGVIYEGLGEYDRAEAELEALLNTSFDKEAKGMLDYVDYKRRETEMLDSYRMQKAASEAYYY